MKNCTVKIDAIITITTSWPHHPCHLLIHCSKTRHHPFHHLHHPRMQINAVTPIKSRRIEREHRIESHATQRRWRRGDLQQTQGKERGWTVWTLLLMHWDKHVIQWLPDHWVMIESYQSTKHCKWLKRTSQHLLNFSSLHTTIRHENHHIWMDTTWYIQMYFFSFCFLIPWLNKTKFPWNKFSPILLDIINKKEILFTVSRDGQLVFGSRSSRRGRDERETQRVAEGSRSFCPRNNYPILWH